MYLKVYTFVFRWVIVFWVGREWSFRSSYDVLIELDFIQPIIWIMNSVDYTICRKSTDDSQEVFSDRKDLYS